MNKIYHLQSGEVIVSATNQKESEMYLGGKHYVYTITIKKGGVKKDFTYHDSICNFNHQIDVTPEMIDSALRCILDDAKPYENYESEWDYGYENGYDMDDSDEHSAASRIYKAAKRAHTKLSALFSLEDKEELCDILASSNR